MAGENKIPLNIRQTLARKIASEGTGSNTGAAYKRRYDSVMRQLQRIGTVEGKQKRGIGKEYTDKLLKNNAYQNVTSYLKTPKLTKNAPAQTPNVTATQEGYIFFFRKFVTPENYIVKLFESKDYQTQGDALEQCKYFTSGEYREYIDEETAGEGELHKVIGYFRPAGEYFTVHQIKKKGERSLILESFGDSYRVEVYVAVPPT